MRSQAFPETIPDPPAVRGRRVVADTAKPSALIKPNKNRHPAIIPAQAPIVRWILEGDAMDHDTSLLTRLKEEARLRQQQHAASRTANQAMTPQVKMIVSDWYTDEIGNQARIIKACD
jgi:hypothetical protein